MDLQRWGAATALIDADGRFVTFAELARLADEFAAALPAGTELIAIEARNCLEALAAYFGALRSGIPAILLPEGRAAEPILNRYRPDACWRLGEASGTWRLDVTPTVGALVPHPDLALLLSTSGSTGSPKLVRLSAAALDANARSIGAYLGLGATDRAITSLPLSYSYGLSVVNSHLAVGAAVVLTEASVVDPVFSELVRTHCVSGIAGVPYSYELMERSGLLDNLPSSLTTLTQAGGRMAPDLVARVAERAYCHGARLFVMYGQTEATARIAFLPPEQLAQHPDAIGGAIPGGELWIEDFNGARLIAGEVGELVYRGPNVMMGYAAGRDDLAEPAGPDILRTGDLAIEIEPGLFRVVGRKSRLAKPFGMRIGLDDLEARCREAGAAVCAAGNDELVVIAATDAADLHAAKHVLKRLDLPSELLEFVQFGELPRTQGGKIDYPAVLRAGCAIREGACSAQANPIDTVARLYHRLAGTAASLEAESFESLGGDSLSYVQCSMAIEDALGELPDGWEKISLSELRARARSSAARLSGWHLTWLESDILVRCLMIMLVLFQHARGGVEGGADVLMVLAGFTWARFQRPRLLAGKVRVVFTDFARRYLILYLAVMAMVFAFNRQVDWPHVLFISTFSGDWGGILNPYWFIESLTWCVATTCLLFTLPAVRQFAAERPSGSGLAFTGIALILLLFGSRLFDSAAHAYRSPDQILVYFAAGWTIALSDRFRQLALFAMLGIVSALDWGWLDSHVAAMVLAAVLIVFVRRVPMPQLIRRTAAAIAAASFYIYILNVIPMYVTDIILHARLGRFWLIQILTSLALGIGARLLLARGADLLDDDRSLLRRLRFTRARVGS